MTDTPNTSDTCCGNCGDELGGIHLGASLDNSWSCSGNELRRLTCERDELRANVAAMRPVVKAAEAFVGGVPQSAPTMWQAVAAYRKETND